jgi:hypothetical protein
MSTGKENGGERDAALASVLWGILTIGLTIAGAEAQPTVTMRLAEAEWHIVRQ